MALFEDTSGPTVDVNALSNSLNYRATGTSICNVKISSDGDFYKSDYLGAYGASSGTWLTSGLNSEVWVERTVTLGTLTTDAGAGRLAMTSDRIFGETAVAVESDQSTVTFEFWDAASGGSSLGSKSITIDAEAGT